VVVLKKPAQTLAATYLAFCRAGALSRQDQLVSEALMVPFSVIMSYEK